MSDESWMKYALSLAIRAESIGEVPIGCVIVRGQLEIGAAHNEVEQRHDATAHAEMLALRVASSAGGSWRLNGATLYTTLEPCPMCAGAILLARVERVVYGASDPKKGADGSAYAVLQSPAGNHHPEVVGGICSEAAGSLLTQFFQRRRANASTTDDGVADD